MNIEQLRALGYMVEQIEVWDQEQHEWVALYQATFEPEGEICYQVQEPNFLQTEFDTTDGAWEAARQDCDRRYQS